MAAPRKPRGRGKPTRQTGIHEDLMREWLGCEKPLDLGKNIASAGDLVADILRKQFFAENLNEEEVKAAWKATAGDFIGAHTEPLSVKEGVLVLRVTQPAMRFHLEQMKPELLKKIRKKFGADRIRAIRFQLG